MPEPLLCARCGGPLKRGDYWMVLGTETQVVGMAHRSIARCEAQWRRQEATDGLPKRLVSPTPVIRPSSFMPLLGEVFYQSAIWDTVVSVRLSCEGLLTCCQDTNC